MMYVGLAALLFSLLYLLWPYLAKGVKKLLTVLAVMASFFILGRTRLLGVILSALAYLPLFENYFKRFDSQGTKARNNIKAEDKMDESEAREILQLKANPTVDEVEKAFKVQMKRHHPDKGGSKYFTKKIIQARNILIKK
jgi:hypothetical protein